MKPKVILGLVGILSGCVVFHEVNQEDFKVLHEERVDAGIYEVIKDSLGCRVEFTRSLEYDWFEDNHFSSYNSHPDLTVILRLTKQYCEENLNK